MLSAKASCLLAVCAAGRGDGAAGWAGGGHAALQPDAGPGNPQVLHPVGAHFLTDHCSLSACGMSAAAQMLEEMVVGRSGNEVLAAVVERMEAEGIDGHIYTHPIGDVMRKSFFLLACALKSLKAAAGRLSQMRRGQTSGCGTCTTDRLRHPASWSCGRRRGSRLSSAPTRGCRSGEGSGSPSSRRRTQWCGSRRREETDGCTEEGGRRPPRCTLCGNRVYLVALHGERLLGRSTAGSGGWIGRRGPSLVLP